MESLLAWLSQYGYAGLFGLLVLGIVGLPVPDETLLAFSGYLISIGRFEAAFAFGAALGGSICGISLSYLIGRTAGHQFVHRFGNNVHLTEARLAAVDRWFERFGDGLLAIGYFIPGVRHFTAFAAGMSRLPYRRFAAFAYSGAAVWVATFLSIGYLLGENWARFLHAFHRSTTALVVILALVCLMAWWFSKRRGEGGTKR